MKSVRKKKLGFIIGPLVLLLVLGIFFTTKKNIGFWLEREINKTITKVWSKDWPIQFIQLKIDTDGSKIYEGQIENISAEFLFQGKKLVLSGPMTNRLEKRKLVVFFDAKLSYFDNPESPIEVYSEVDIHFDLNNQKLNAFNLVLPKQSLSLTEFDLSVKDLTVNMEAHFKDNQLSQVALNLKSGQVAAEKGIWSLSLEQLAMNSKMEPKNYNVDLSLSGLSLSDQKEEKAMNLSAVQFNLKGELKNNFPDKKVNYQLVLGELEGIWNEEYFSADLNSTQFKGFFELVENKFTVLNRFELDTKLFGTESLSLKLNSPKGLMFNQPSHGLFNVSANISKWDLARLYQQAKSIYEFPMSQDVDLRAGELDIQLSAKRVSLADLSGELPKKVQMDTRLKRLEVFYQPLGALLKGLSLDWDLKLNQPSPLALHMDLLGFKNLEVSLKKAKVNTLVAAPKGIESLRVDLLTPVVPLKVNQLPLSWDNFSFSFYQAQQKPQFSFHSDMKLEYFETHKIEQMMCMKPGTLPPAKIYSTPLSLDLEKGRIKFDGQIQAEIFEGFFQIKNIKVYRLLSRLPETQLDMEWDNLQLYKIGEWLNFGKMDGQMKGHFRKAVFQKTLPTQFDFEFRLLPQKGDTVVVFSAPAMRNFVSLFADPSYFDQLPGWLDTLVFGWPSDLIQGYDVQYAGMSMFSKNGSVLVETFDPKEQEASFWNITNRRKKEKHYILYGNRFKIPIGSDTYPVVLDSYGLSELVDKIMAQIEVIKNQGEAEAEAKAEEAGVEAEASPKATPKKENNDVQCKSYE